MSYLSTKVGVYTAVKSRKTGSLVYVLNKKMSKPLSEVLSSTDFTHRINAYRSTKKKSIKDQIGAFTPSGFYPDKRLRTVPPETQTNLIQIDIDGKVNGDVTDWPAYRDYLFNKYSFIAVCSLSCGGGGIYLLINTTGYENYEGHFFAATEFLSSKEDLNIDVSVSSANEIRYLSLPGDCMIRPDATVFDLIKPKPKNEFDGIATRGDGALVEVPQSIRGTMQRKHVVDFVTSNLHNGVALETVNSYLAAHCKDFILKESHMYGDAEGLTTLARDLYGRYADQFNQSAQSGHKVKLSGSTRGIKPGVVMRHPATQDREKAMRDAEKVRVVTDWLHTRCSYDVIGDQYVNAEGVTNPALEHQIYNLDADEMTFIEKHFFINVFEAGSIPRINSLKIWADSLPVWDKKDHVKKLVSYLPAKDMKVAEVFIKAWCIRAYVQAVNPDNRDPTSIVNRWFLILHQHKQDSGKTSLLQWLCPNINWVKMSGIEEGKDGYTALAKYFFVLDDELNGLGNFKFHERLKSMVSTAKIDVRPPYAKNDVSLPRCASFCGSTNNDKIFPATEGNTRFLVVPLHDRLINWREYVKTVDKVQLWSQIKHLVSTDWIDKNESYIIEQRNNINQDLLKDNAESFVVSKYLIHDDNAPVKLTGDIIEELTIINDQYARLNVNLLGQALRHKFGERVNGYLKNGDRRMGYKVSILTRITGRQNPDSPSGSAPNLREVGPRVRLKSWVRWVAKPEKGPKNHC